jgi:UrcA family protein
MRMIASIALVLAAASAAASAEPPSRAVRYADLDLATSDGVAALDRRIGHAIEQICGTAVPADLDSQAAIQLCRVASWKEVAGRRSTLLAAARAGSPRLALTIR